MFVLDDAQHEKNGEMVVEEKKLGLGLNILFLLVLFFSTSRANTSERVWDNKRGPETKWVIRGFIGLWLF